MTGEPESSKPPLIEGGLPAKITGIVFWGMVLIGSLAVAMLLHGQDSAQSVRNSGNGMVLAHKIEDTLTQQSVSMLQPLHSDLNRLAEQLRPSLGFQAIRLELDKEVWIYGEIDASQSAVSHVLSIPAVSPGQPFRTPRITVYFPSQLKSAIEKRKDTLLGIGVVIILFGLVLQKILQRLLSRPFTNMVSCARQSADGDMAARFDENRTDEFGFLAKFINRALDSLTRQRAELQMTLARALQSEAALSWEKKRAEVTLHSITDAVITTSSTSDIEYMNPAAESLTGWSNAEAHHKPLGDVIQLVHETSGAPLPNPIDACLRHDAVATLDQHAALLHRNGERISVQTSAAPMRNDQDEVFGAVMVFQDVRHARRLTNQLSYQASHDLITGLYNRLKFEERLNSLLAETSADQEHALFYLDLDQFKIVNDTCGHIAGDELLRQVSAALQEEMRKEDTLARLGGDEFGVLLKNCSLSNARIIAEKLRQRIKNLRFGWQDKTFEIGVSIGVVAITPDHPGASGILSTADLSCYTAKDMGRNRIHVYEPTDTTLAQRHGEMCWTTLIVQALNDNRFLLYQQPIRATLAGNARQNHHEILIRMQSPDQGIIKPGSFIPAAERYNLMPGIDRWVIRHVFAAIAGGAFGPPSEDEGRMIAINLSGASLGDDGLFEFIRATRDEFGIAFSEICFEITETVAISNLSRATHLMRELRTLGCRFALDDFGSGLSSFAYLKNLPVDYIKIDGGFVKDIVTDPIDRAMVEAIHQIGKIMKIQTIAEWVENEATRAILEEIGVDFAQGYHIGPPQPVQLPARRPAESRQEADNVLSITRVPAPTIAHPAAPSVDRFSAGYSASDGCGLLK